MNLEPALPLLQQYRSKGIIVDANLLLLYFVGRIDPDLISTFKRTRNRGFTVEEYQALAGMLKHVGRTVVTPHILTEVSNYLGQLKQTNAFVRMAEFVRDLEESFKEARTLVQNQHFPRFGLTDTAILDLAPGKHLVLSVDADLVIRLTRNGVDAINFNHLR